MLTNFATIRKAVRKMANIDKMFTDGTSDNMSKKERLQVSRERAKLEKNLGSISDLSRLPAALFIVDISKEHIAVAEAKKLSIPTFAIVDTNSNPNEVDFPIPANDDAAKSISLIVRSMVESIEEGIAERKFDKDKQTEDEKEAAAEIEKLKAKTLAELEEQEDDDEEKKAKKAAAKAATLKLKEGLEEEKEEKPKRPVIKSAKPFTKRPTTTGGPKKSIK